MTVHKSVQRLESRRWAGERTINDPGLDLRRLDLQRGRDHRVGEVAADVLEPKRCEGQEANLALQL